MIDYEKELEQKAQRYDDALERAKSSLMDGTISTNTIAYLQDIFPELGESKDEKIRKAVIEMIHDTPSVECENYNVCKNDILDWLEKQKAMDKKIIFRALPGTDIVDAASQAIEKIEIGKEVVLAFNGAYIPVNGNTVAEIYNEYFAWTEKQGEQKHTDKVEPKFKVGDWVVTSYGKVNQVIAVDKDGDGFTLDDGTYFSGSWKDDYHLWTIADAKDGDVLVDDLGNICIYKESSLKNMYYSYCYGNHKYFVDRGGSHVIEDTCPATKEQRDTLFKKIKEEGYEWDTEKKELKKITTPQPKFKVGDWIANDYCDGKVIALTDDAYLLDSGQGIPFSCEHNTHLWTIQDAKDGDVLVDVYGNIGIFQKNDDFDWSSYCSLGSNGGFRCFAIEHELDGSHPATKEQRDLLFQKMKEEGYEWDAEKKELKKIEDEPENYKKTING